MAMVWHVRGSQELHFVAATDIEDDMQDVADQSLSPFYAFDEDVSVGTALLHYLMQVDGATIPRLLTPEADGIHPFLQFEDTIRMSSVCGAAAWLERLRAVTVLRVEGSVVDAVLPSAREEIATRIRGLAHIT